MMLNDYEWELLRRLQVSRQELEWLIQRVGRNEFNTKIGNLERRHVPIRRHAYSSPAHMRFVQPMLPRNRTVDNMALVEEMVRPLFSIQYNAMRQPAKERLSLWWLTITESSPSTTALTTCIVKLGAQKVLDMRLEGITLGAILQLAKNDIDGNISDALIAEQT